MSRGNGFISVDGDCSLINSVWFILVVLLNSVVYTDFTGSWIVSWWRVAYCYCFWRFGGGGSVIHWLTNEVSLVAGWCWVNRETSGGLTGEDGCLFDVNHGIWGNRVTLFDGVSRVVVVGIAGDSVKSS